MNRKSAPFSAAPAQDAAAPATAGVLIEWMVPFYDALCRLVGLGRAFRRHTLSLAEVGPGARVLDAGCGTGVLTRLAAALVGPSGAAIGIDPGPKMIRRARRDATRTRSAARFELAAVERLPFPDASFDAVFLSAVLHHLTPDLKRTGLAEILRVLRPGGRLVVADIDRPVGILGVLFRLFRHHPTIGPQVREGISALLASAGFAPVAAAGRWNSALAFWVATKPAGARP
ncbi:MAG TPA: methyltransferase domain-containing protein [Alphaproteobacteria bacterium]|jgi:ubiquinone/menaquinone biosynthesis C-methylase UbiE